MSDDVVLPKFETGKYLHAKTGHFYEVIGIALHTETNEPLIVYRPLEDSAYALYTRPYDMFVQLIEIDGEHVARFQKVDD